LRSPADRPDREEAVLAEHQKRDPVAGDQREALHEPAVARQRGKHLFDTRLADRQPLRVICVLGHKRECLWAIAGARERRPRRRCR
jgi:hypothetical protein